MLQTIEVEIDTGGRIHPVEPFEHLPAGRALLTLLTPVGTNIEPALLAENALAEDWLKPEEDTAWAPLGRDNGAAVLALLRSPLFREAPSGDPKVLEATIQSNRDAWDER
jgi:hypothetical protein